MRAGCVSKTAVNFGLMLGLVCSPNAVVFAQAPHRGVTEYGYWGGWQGDAIARATARAQTEPGVTEELAPDAKQTATGGPSGGVPGFSGH